MRIVITGATGYVGKPLVESLLANGATVIAVSRDAARAAAALPGAEVVEGQLEQPGDWTAALAGADAVVHLAGELIAGKRWDAAQKQRIRDSRVATTARIVDAIAALDAARRPRALLNASAIDYYAFAATGPDDAADVDEAAPPGDSFLGEVCRDWEAEALRAESLGVRVVRMRTGLILGPGSAVLRKMIPQFRWFLGGRIGSGAQWLSWIHLDDAVGAYRAALADDRYRGAINVVAPEAIRQRELATALGRALHRPSVVPTPAFAVRAAVGELAIYALEGRKVVPTALKRLGFWFARPTIDEALRDL
jgi:uncharacterized protein (TIGR01777 family)